LRDKRIWLFILAAVLLLTGCKDWNDLSHAQQLLIKSPEFFELASEGVVAGADLAGKGVTEFSECVIELKEKAFDESKYRGFIECSPK